MCASRRGRKHCTSEQLDVVLVRKWAKGGQAARLCLTNPVHDPVELTPTKAVTNRDAVSGCIGRAEFDVVVNQVQARLGANEGITPEIGAKTASEVSHKVIAADVIGTAGNKTTTQARGVKPQILAANARHQLSGKVLGKLGHPDGIEGPEDWAIGLEASV